MIGREVTRAVRRLRVSPIFALFAILTLSLGVGATTAIYATVHALFAPPPGLGDQDRLVTVVRSDRGSVPLVGLAWPEYIELETRQTAFDGLAAWRFLRAGYVAQGVAGVASVEAVSGGYFRTLGISAESGRLLAQTDDVPNGQLAAVISSDLAARLFANLSDAVGTSLRVNSRVFTIVGVVSEEFKGLFNGGLVRTDVWIPLNTLRVLPGDSGSFDPADLRHRWLSLTGHLAPGRRVEDARAEFVAMGKSLDGNVQLQSPNRAFPAGPWLVRELRDTPRIISAGAIEWPLSAVVFLASALVLLVACTNLANLMLARSAGRRNEIGVQLALGASKGQIIREIVAEAALLAAVGGGTGILVARALVTALATPITVTRGIAIQISPVMDLSVVAVSLAASLLALVVAGIGPAWQASRADATLVLAPGEYGGPSTRWRGRRYLIAVQVAVSALLIAVAGVAATQVGRTESDSGMRSEHLALAEVNFAQQEVDPTSAVQATRQVLEQVGDMPGVTAVAASSGLPIGSTAPVGIAQANGTRLQVKCISATASVFAALGVKFILGRGFSDSEGPGGTGIVVGEKTGRALFGSDDVLGRTIELSREPGGKTNAEAFTIVGTVEEPGWREGRQGVVYLAITSADAGRVFLMARTTGDAAPAVTWLRQAVQVAAPTVGVTQALTGEALVAQDSLFYQVTAMVAAALGGLAVVVALAGLYGILSFLIAGRTREIGIRIALGARRPWILRGVLVDGMRPVLVGLVIGLTSGAIARRALQPLFVRLVPAIDPWVILAVPVLFITAGLAAAYLPAYRASRVDPIVALRHQ
jgi:putative ABC transport system permease protein